MTHEGRMQRGAENVKKGILPDNEDTLYYLKNHGSEAAPAAEEPPKKSRKKRGK